MNPNITHHQDHNVHHAASASTARTTTTFTTTTISSSSTTRTTRRSNTTSHLIRTILLLATRRRTTRETTRRTSMNKNDDHDDGASSGDAAATRFLMTDDDAPAIITAAAATTTTAAAPHEHTSSSTTTAAKNNKNHCNCYWWDELEYWLEMKPRRRTRSIRTAGDDDDGATSTATTASAAAFVSTQQQQQQQKRQNHRSSSSSSLLLLAAASSLSDASSSASSSISIEDCLPLPDLIYPLLIQLLYQTWITTTMVISSPTTNDDDDDSVVVVDEDHSSDDWDENNDRIAVLDDIDTTTTTTVHDDCQEKDRIIQILLQGGGSTHHTTTAGSIICSHHVNPLLHLHHQVSSSSSNNNNQEEEISLTNAFDSLRITHILRYWMEYNLSLRSGSNSSRDDIDASVDKEEEEQQQEEAVILDDNIISKEDLPNPSMIMERDISGNNIKNKRTTTTSSSYNIIQKLLLVQHPNISSIQYIVSLFRHVQLLPIIQSYLYQYIQTIQRNQLPIMDSMVTYATTTTTTASSNDTSTMMKDRMKQIQHVQQCIHQLEKEWENHMEYIYDILIATYQYSNVIQRQFIRNALGQIWTDYIRQTTTTTIGNPMSTNTTKIGFMQENTVAASIRVTLRVVHRILLGMTFSSSASTLSSSTSSSSTTMLSSSSSWLTPQQDHLLFHILIPLHRTSHMVLWRDQMSMLELYHETLVQCIAVIIQKQQQLHQQQQQQYQHHQSQEPDNNDESSSNNNKSIYIIPRIIQAMIDDPDILGSSSSSSSSLGGSYGNTPKQVLLLHEIDTLLGLLPINITATTTSSSSSLSSTMSDGDIHRMLSFVVDTSIHTLPWMGKRNSAAVLTQTTSRSLKFSTTTSSSSLTTRNHKSWWLHLLQMLAQWIASDNSRLSERALQFFQNKKFFSLLLFYESESIPSTSSSSQLITNSFDTLVVFQILLPVLVRTEPSWNPTVRKMTYYVLSDMENKLGPDRWTDICNQVFSTTASTATNDRGKPIVTTTTTPPKTSTLWSTDEKTEESQAHVPMDTSLRAGMGDWKPPTPSSSSSSFSTASMLPPPTRRTQPSAMQQPNQPPLTVTGVAPWATPRPPGGRLSLPVKKTAGLNPPVTITGVAPWALSQPLLPVKKTAGVNPPVTITGVAPWAVSQPSLPVKKTGAKRPGPSMALPPLAAMEEDHEEESKMQDEEEKLLVAFAGEDTSKTGIERVRVYMVTIQPPREHDGMSSWSLDQLATTPTLLPGLKFHDLVFGQELGVGAFSTVKYARKIDRAVTRSYWSEYAVKVIATDKIRELGYEASVQREIAVLRILSHPGVARLVSSFRFREGAYLVLEYASRGDLHNLLRKHGSLDQDSTRFVIGEVIAVLASIHDLGFVYGDLKPENIVITEPGHIKLTDFGGCRPVTPEAKSMVTSIAKNILASLRDGDWKSSDGGHNDSGKGVGSVIGSVDEAASEEETEEDVRIEGTTAYLPPEVVLGGVPTYVADSWALGCVMYQCLSGRPPLLDIDDEATRRRIVSFELPQDTLAISSTDPTHELFSGPHASMISTEARDLITKLLNHEPQYRPTMHRIADHDFFTSANINVFTLYQGPAYPLDVGNVSPAAADSRWTRRQFSSIWAPQPVAYDVSVGANSSTSKTSSIHSPFSSIPSFQEPILEGDESLGYFAPFATTPAKSKTLENVPERPPIPRNS